MKDCNQCGKCCIKYGGNALYASSDDIKGWETFNPEISQYVKNNEIWFDPRTGEQLSRCPFLAEEPKQTARSPARYICTIYEHRPEDCRAYPSLVSEMINDDCEMLEPVDRDKPRHAQTLLNIINLRA